VIKAMSPKKFINHQKTKGCFVFGIKFKFEFPRISLKKITCLFLRDAIQLLPVPLNSSTNFEAKPRGDSQGLAARHFRNLQHLRDQTLVQFSALSLCPRDSIEKTLLNAQPYLKDHKVDSESCLEDAFLSLALTSLQRLLRLNAGFFTHLYSNTNIQDAGGLKTESPAAVAKTGSDKIMGIFESFQKDLQASGANQLPSSAISSLIVFERIIAETLFGSALGSEPRPDVLELVLIEVQKNSAETASINAQPWKISLRKRDTPSVDSRLLNAFFNTVFVVALEALQIASKKPKPSAK